MDSTVASRGNSKPPAVPPAPSDAPRSKATGAIAWIMDEVISIPGTKIKIGLDPILAALPAFGLPVGDAVTSGISLVALVEAVRRGLSFKAMMQIAVNILINAGFGAVPVVGNVCSVFFRSNSRNRDVINQHLKEAIESGRRASWLRVIPVLIFLFVFVMGALALNMVLWALLISLVFQYFGWDIPSPNLGN